MKAIHYAQAEWQGLVRYTTDGRYRPDNNYAEAVMRDLATGERTSSSQEVTKQQRTLHSHIHSLRAAGFVTSTHTTTGRII